MTMRLKRSRPLPYPVRFAVLGGGSFGLALASVLGKKSIPVTILVRKPEVAREINEHQRHPTYLSDIQLAPSIRATTDPAEALSTASFIIHAVPVQYSRKFLTEVAQYVPRTTPVISVSKGIETDSLSMMQDILFDTLGPAREVAFLSGPSFAREIAQGLATAVVVASESDQLANEVCDLLSSDYFRVFTSTDVVGVEVRGCAALAMP
jgi:glycerol-3-phosphate dehydrogenase (NAD+)